MVIKYTNDKTTTIYKTHNGKSYDNILIYGDEVELIGSEKNGRIPIKFRNRKGWINKNELSSNSCLEIYFIDVGQGDSTFIVTPKRKKILIDGGITDRAFRFLAWKYRLEDVKTSNPIVIDLLVLSHADSDHINGLIPVISNSKIKIKKIVHNGLAIYNKGSYDEKLGNIKIHEGNKYIETHHDSLNELDDSKLTRTFKKWKNEIINDGETAYNAVDSTSENLDIGDPSIKLEILGPKIDRLSSINKKYYRWFGDHGHTINGHSVILLLTYKEVQFLFSGDINIDGSKHILEDKEIRKRLNAHVLKSPHHGSHEFHLPFLKSINPQISVISSGDDVDHGHPRASFLGAIGSVSRNQPLIFSTEIGGNFIEMDEKLEKINLTKEEKKKMSPTTLRKLRLLFKRRLHGMINVRTDGNHIFAARRVASSYMWESYGPIKPTAMNLNS